MSGKPCYTIVGLIMLLGFCSQLLPAGCTASPDTPIDRQVSVGTHRLHIYCAGKGNPPVVIETGSGETYESWLPLINRLAQNTRVCAYDRAGYGQSEAGPLPRDAGREADELRLLLQKAGVKGPYVLVGHSLGGLSARVFSFGLRAAATTFTLTRPSLSLVPFSRWSCMHGSHPEGRNSDPHENRSPIRLFLLFRSGFP